MQKCNLQYAREQWLEHLSDMSEVRALFCMFSPARTQHVQNVILTFKVICAWSKCTTANLYTIDDFYNTLHITL